MGLEGAFVWGGKVGKLLLQHHQFHDASIVVAAEPGEVEAAGEDPSVLVQAVPGHRVLPGRRSLIEQGAQMPALYIEDGQFDPAVLGQGEGDPCTGIKRVGQRRQLERSRRGWRAGSRR